MDRVFLKSKTVTITSTVVLVNGKHEAEFESDSLKPYIRYITLGSDSIGVKVCNEISCTLTYPAAQKVKIVDCITTKKICSPEKAKI